MTPSPSGSALPRKVALAVPGIPNAENADDSAGFADFLASAAPQTAGDLASPVVATRQATGKVPGKTLPDALPGPMADGMPDAVSQAEDAVSAIEATILSILVGYAPSAPPPLAVETIIPSGQGGTVALPEPTRAVGGISEITPRANECAAPLRRLPVENTAEQTPENVSTPDIPSAPSQSPGPVLSLPTGAPAFLTPAAAVSGHDFATLVDRLVAAREAAMPQVVQASVAHAEFGRVTMRFEQDDAGLSVAMSSPDPEFAGAVRAAAPAEASPGSADARENAARGGHSSQTADQTSTDDASRQPRSPLRNRETSPAPAGDDDRQAAAPTSDAPNSRRHGLYA